MDARRGAVVLIVTEHELDPALFDRGPLAGVEQCLKLIQAWRGGWPATVAVPGKPAPAADPPPDTIHGRKRDQADNQAGEGHEEQEGHSGVTRRATQTFPAKLPAAAEAHSIAAYRTLYGGRSRSWPYPVAEGNDESVRKADDRSMKGSVISTAQSLVRRHDR